MEVPPLNTINSGGRASKAGLKRCPETLSRLLGSAHITHPRLQMPPALPHAGREQSQVQ